MKARHDLPGADGRIKIQDVKKYGILGYDVDNAYPQRMIELANASGTTKQAVGLYAKYIIGGGFQDPAFYKKSINGRGLTPDRLLRRISGDFGMMKGFAIHVNYNAAYQISSINYLPFENTRLTLDKIDSADNKEARPNMIAINKKWHGRSILGRFSSPVKKEDITYIHRYNPDPNVIEAQVLEADGWENYRGQVFWFSADFDTYPLCSFDAVIESVKAEIASDKTTTSNLENNFALKMVYVVKGKFEDESERQEHYDIVKGFMGPDGKQVMIAEVTDDEEAPTFLPVKTALDDKLFQYTDEKVIRKIIRHYNQPAILHSITDGGYFNQQQLHDAMTYYNGVTQDERYEVEQVFTDIFSRFHEEINSSGNYSIMPLKYGEDQIIDDNATD